MNRLINTFRVAFLVPFFLFSFIAPKKIRLEFNPVVGTELSQVLSADMSISIAELNATSTITSATHFSSKVESKHPASRVAVVPCRIDSMLFEMDSPLNGGFKTFWNSNRITNNPQANALSSALNALILREVIIQINSTGKPEYKEGLETINDLIEDEQGIIGLSANPYDNFTLMFVEFIDRKIKLAQTWSVESSILNQGMLLGIQTEYQLIDINIETAEIAIRSTLNIPKTAKVLNGANFEFSMIGTMSGQSTVDIKTGITIKSSRKQNLAITLVSKANGASSKPIILSAKAIAELNLRTTVN